MAPTFDDIATGIPEEPRKLKIGGRPRPGAKETFVILEEPGEPVQMHWVRMSESRGSLFPHFRRDCPYCEHATEEPKPMYYVGAARLNGDLIIAELTEACYLATCAAARRYRTAESAIAQDSAGDVYSIPQPTIFTGLMIHMIRPQASRLPRYIRCEQRVAVKEPWPHQTRRELARIWRVPVRPRLYREQA